MNLIPVTSSMLQAIGTDGNDLVVQFNNGKIYRYIAAASEFDAMKESESCGKYINSMIKPNYTAELVES